MRMGFTSLRDQLQKYPTNKSISEVQWKTVTIHRRVHTALEPLITTNSTQYLFALSFSSSSIKSSMQLLVLGNKARNVVNIKRQHWGVTTCNAGSCFLKTLLKHSTTETRLSSPLLFMLTECVTGTHKPPALNVHLEANSQGYCVQGWQKVDLGHFAQKRTNGLWCTTVCLLMTPGISRRNASACDKATLTDKKIEGVPQGCLDTVLLGLFIGFWWTCSMV